MIRSFKERREQEEGFTLIELMVVVLIIAILLAIAIPTFLGAQNRAKDRGAQSNLRNSLTAAKTIATDSEGFFTGVSASSLNTAEPSINHVTAFPATTSAKNVKVAVSAGEWSGTAMTGTTPANGVLYLTVQSASGQYFGLCADHKGTVKYAPGASTEPGLSACTADKF